MNLPDYSLVQFSVCCNQASSQKSGLGWETEQGSSCYSGPPVPPTFSLWGSRSAAHVHIAFTYSTSRRSLTQADFSLLLPTTAPWSGLVTVWISFPFPRSVSLVFFTTSATKAGIWLPRLTTRNPVSLPFSPRCWTKAIAFPDWRWSSSICQSPEGLGRGWPPQGIRLRWRCERSHSSCNGYLSMPCEHIQCLSYSIRRGRINQVSLESSKRRDVTRGSYCAYPCYCQSCKSGYILL